MPGVINTPPLQAATEVTFDSFSGSTPGPFASMPLAKPPKKKTPKTPNTAIRLLKVGADVEQFMLDTDGLAYPACGLIGGTKTDPLPILQDIGTGYAIQEDNVAVEYNIPPSDNAVDFAYSIKRVQEEIHRRVKELGYAPAIEAAMRFKADRLLHPQAKAFGCEPDYNVWEQRINDSPATSPDAATLRTAGGHVHVSFLVDGNPPEYPAHLVQMEAMVMGMDVFLGIPMLALEPSNERRKLYGQPGAFRPKAYGVEYRVLSNFWTTNPLLAEYVFNQVHRLTDWLSQVKEPRAHLLHYKENVYKAFGGNKDHAIHIMAEFGQLPGKFLQPFVQPAYAKAIY